MPDIRRAIERAKQTNLTELHLGDNQLTTLPAEIGELTNLTRLDLEGNQLPDSLMALANEGVDELLTYLRSLSGV